jgi:hypothetical protein
VGVGAALVLLAACALRAWHVLLVRLLRGGPPEIAWWLAAAFVLVVAGRAAARRQPDGSRGRLARRWAALDWPALSMFAFVLALVWLFDLGFERAASDGREYFVQVRSLVIDRDLDFANENAVFGVRGTADVYAFGAALLWAPFFLAAHAWLGFLNFFGGGFTLDGYSNAYQRAVGLGTLAYGAAGLALIFRMLSEYYARTLAALATIALTAGSFLVWYLTVDNSMVHGVSMFATTLFLYAWHGIGPAPSSRQWIGLGAAAGLMALMRWQNVLFAVVPLALSTWALVRQPRTGDRSTGGPLQAVRGLGLAAAAAGLTFVPQLVFWKVARGGWFAVPAAEHGVRLSELHLADVLFSSNHGLLSSSPLLYLALPGLVLFARRDWRLAAALGAGLAAQIYINSAVEVWWGGAGFGARRFANSALVFAVGLAAMLDWTRRHPLVAPAAIAGVLVFVNAAVALDVRRGRLPASEATTFDAMLDSAYARAGNPFSFPMNAWVAWTYGGGPVLYDQLRGRTYNNLLIDVGEDADEPFLVEGWFARERAPDLSFRWSAGARSALVVPLKEPAAYRLDLRCAPFGFPGAPGQTVEVVVNGRSVTTLRLVPGWNDLGVALDAMVMRANLNRIELRYGYSRSPRDAGLGDDERELAVQCDWIRLTRQ